MDQFVKEMIQDSNRMYWDFLQDTSDFLWDFPREDADISQIDLEMTIRDPVITSYYMLKNNGFYSGSVQEYRTLIKKLSIDTIDKIHAACASCIIESKEGYFWDLKKELVQAVLIKDMVGL